MYGYYCKKCGDAFSHESREVAEIEQKVHARMHRAGMTRVPVKDAKTGLLMWVRPDLADMMIAKGSAVKYG